MVHEIYERSFARFRALASDMYIIGDCDNQVERSKEEFTNWKASGFQVAGGILKRSTVSGGGEEKYMIGDCDNQVERSKEEFTNRKASGFPVAGGIFKRSRVSGGGEKYMIGDCDNQVVKSKEEFINRKAIGFPVAGGFSHRVLLPSIFKRSRVSDGGEEIPGGEPWRSPPRQLKRLTELMWLMPMLIGNTVHGNADNPPVPMGPMAAYDLDSADEQQDKDEAGQRVVAKAIGPAYMCVYFIIVLVYFADGGLLSR